MTACVGRGFRWANMYLFESEGIPSLFDISFNYANLFDEGIVYGASGVRLAAAPVVQ